MAEVPAVGDSVFVNHPRESWVTGKITAVDDKKKTCTVLTDDSVRKCVGVVLEKVKYERNVTPLQADLLDETPHDLLSLTVLHDATLLRCLYIRYMKDIVYTNIGAIVVALNPFNFKIPHYTDDNMVKYLKEGAVIEHNLPHSWAQAHNTFNEMMVERGNQCILISGESGAGKTEATKIVMKYLAQIAAKQGTAEEREEGLQVGKRLNMCSPVLEAFGNAKTVRNDNSSRFGKFMQVKFNDRGLLVGSFTIKYLLEKSRIVTAMEGERCYHSLYVTTRGWAATKLGLKPDTYYKSINVGKMLHCQEFDTAEDFKEVTDAMSALGMADDEILSVWKVTGGCLHILNMSFDPDGEGSVISSQSKDDAKKGFELWGVNAEKLETEFRKTTLQIPGGEIAVKELNPTLAVDIRDATVKAVYNGLFGWLVGKCNDMCDVGDIPDGSWIGLLDIFGFEDFKVNSFEQICINFANETLQNHYNAFIFEKDMAECRAEGIDVTEVACPDNMPCLKLIKDKGGILDMLDEECMLGKGTDLSFCEKLIQTWEKKSPQFFGVKKMSKHEFIVHHYAGSVVYDVTGWLDKNRDTVKDDIREIVRAAADPVLAITVEPPLEKKSGGSKKITVGYFFNDQVRLLMEMINSTNPHWIRTVKPHPAKKPLKFDGVSTMNQLESSGVLGTVKIRKAGYPVRQLIDRFNVRFKIMCPEAATLDGRELSIAILTHCGLNERKFAQVGKTKVFLKADAWPLLEKYRVGFLASHADFIALCVEEFRDYLQRSIHVKAARLQAKKEAEEALARAVETVMKEAQTAFDDAYQEWMFVTTGVATAYHTEIERHKKKIAAEKERLERLQAALRHKEKELLEAELAHRLYISQQFEERLQAMYPVFAFETEICCETEKAIIDKDEQRKRLALIKQEEELRSRFLRAISMTTRSGGAAAFPASPTTHKKFATQRPIAVSTSSPLSLSNPRGWSPTLPKSALAATVTHRCPLPSAASPHASLSMSSLSPPRFVGIHIDYSRNDDEDVHVAAQTLVFRHIEALQRQEIAKRLELYTAFHAIYEEGSPLREAMDRSAQDARKRATWRELLMPLRVEGAQKNKQDAEEETGNDNYEQIPSRGHSMVADGTYAAHPHQYTSNSSLVSDDLSPVLPAKPLTASWMTAMSRPPNHTRPDLYQNQQRSNSSLLNAAFTTTRHRCSDSNHLNNDNIQRYAQNDHETTEGSSSPYHDHLVQSALLPHGEQHNDRSMTTRSDVSNINILSRRGLQLGATEPSSVCVSDPNKSLGKQSTFPNPNITDYLLSTGTINQRNLQKKQAEQNRRYQEHTSSSSHLSAHARNTPGFGYYYTKSSSHQLSEEDDRRIKNQRDYR